MPIYYRCTTGRHTHHITYTNLRKLGYVGYAKHANAAKALQPLAICVFAGAYSEEPLASPPGPENGVK